MNPKRNPIARALRQLRPKVRRDRTKYDRAKERQKERKDRG